MGTRTGVGVYFASPTSHGNAVWETDMWSSEFKIQGFSLSGSFLDVEPRFWGSEACPEQ